ncbi:MAG: hypothetical protein HYU36_19795 [Planctomycetes bacterium]|nr:hypothetical protein [Planctomycetota bacterium]
MKRRKFWIRLVLWGSVLLLLFPILIALGTLALVHAGAFDSAIQNMVREKGGVDLRFQRLSFVFPATVVITQAELKATGSAPEVLPITCEKLFLRFDLSSLSEVRLDEIEVEGLHLAIGVRSDYSLATLPGGFELGQSSGAPPAAHRQQRIVPGTTPVLPAGPDRRSPVLPRQVWLKQARAILEFPGGERLETVLDATLQITEALRGPQFAANLRGCGDLLGNPFQYELHASFSRDGLTAPARFLLDIPETANLAGTVASQGRHLLTSVDIETGPISLEKVRLQADRIGLPFPQATGTVEFQGRAAVHWNRDTGSARSVSYRGKVSAAEMEFPLGEGGRLRALAATFNGEFAGEFGYPSPSEMSFRDSEVVLIKPRMGLPGEESWSPDRFLLKFDSAIGPEAVFARGGFSIQRAGETVSGDLDIAFDPRSLTGGFLAEPPPDPAVLPGPDVPPASESAASTGGSKRAGIPAGTAWIRSFRLDWPGIGRMGLVASLKGPHLAQLEKAIWTVEGLDLGACFARFREYCPPVIGGWTLSGQLDATLEATDIPLFPMREEGLDSEGVPGLKLSLRPQQVTLKNLHPLGEPATPPFPAVLATVTGEMSLELHPVGPDFHRIKADGDAVLGIVEFELRHGEAQAVRIHEAQFRGIYASEFRLGRAHGVVDLALSTHRGEGTLHLTDAKAIAGGWETSLPRATVKATLSSPPQVLDLVGEGTVQVRDEALACRVEARLAGEGLDMRRLEVQWPGVGRAELQASADARLEALSKACLRLDGIDVDALAKRLGGLLPPEVGAWHPRGRLDATVDAGFLPLPWSPGGMSPSDPVLTPVKVTLDLTDFSATYAGLVLPGLELPAEIVASCGGRAEGSLKLDARAGRLESARMDHLSVKCALSANTLPERPSILWSLQLAPDCFKLESLKCDWPGLGQLDVEAEGFRQGTGEVALNAAEFGGPIGLARAMLGPLKAETGRARLSIPDLGRLFDIGQRRLPEPWRNYRPGGALSARLSLRSLLFPCTRLPDLLEGEVQLRGASVLPRDPNRVEGLENLDLDVRFQLVPSEGVSPRQEDSEKDAVRGEVSVHLANALLYRDVFLQDLAGREVFLGLSGLFDAGGSGLTEGKAFLQIPDEFRVDVDSLEAAWRPDLRLAGRVQVPQIRNEKALDDLRQAIGDSWPRLKALRLTGTSCLEAGVSVARDRWTARGRLGLSGADLQYGSLSARGLEVDLPFDLASPGTDPPESGGSVPGHLSAEGVQAGPLRTERLALPVQIQRNRLITGALHHPLYGGVLDVTPVETTDLLGPRVMASGQLELKGIHLEELCGSLGLPRGSGRLDARLDSIAFESPEVNLNGDISLSLLGGTVRVSRLSVRRLFTDLAAVELDLMCRDISIEQATGLSSSFPRMTGVLEGDVRGLEFNLAAMQPSRFDASFRTVKRAGVRQAISGELVKILAAAWGQAAIADLFNLAGEHPYREFGFTCRLHNEHLTFRGVERGADYEEILSPPRIARVRIAIRLSGRDATISYSQFEENLRTAVRDALRALDSKVEVKTE